ncbi:DUF262 domain-containing protein [Dietzia cinnamea]|uniref:DUF262 domain-containing protein n=2 Tax=Dietzia cinnamea TaxID=321318 RepID=UPI0021A6E41E|nr:DUF262 domain-containing HNH endonuclease family protein [Dietzia cinnamea]MCT2121659.1 DUF262 domain-containing HNH endonuclease family protein [Dietzia cinnamea]MCT2304415.1 DUF262 domain-containing HNH endonuclease family protein [Dietzia cinnamea]
MSTGMFNANDQPIIELLSPHSTVRYVIPKYQREYSWGKNQWDELFDDIYESESAQGHFLGTIISLARISGDVNEHVFELIDGQQRITSLSVLLATLYAILRDNKADLDDDQLADFVGLKKQLVSSKDGFPRLHLQDQNTNNDDYRYLLHSIGLIPAALKPVNHGNRRIALAFGHFRRRVDAITRDLTGPATLDEVFTLLNKINQSVIVNITVHSHANAFRLFESLNNRGMPLTPVDILKNTVLSETTRAGNSTDLAFEKWQLLLGSLGDSYSTQERFFRQYYNAFRSTLVGSDSSRIATRSNLVDLHEKLISVNVDRYIDQITAAGEKYSVILGHTKNSPYGPDLDKELVSLRRAQGAASYMLLLQLMTRQDDLAVSSATLTGVTRLLTSFFVRRNITNTPPTHRIDRMFMEIIESSKSAPEEQIESFIRSRLIAESASEAEFSAALRGPIYEDNVDMLRFIFASLEADHFTKENEANFWSRTSNRYDWTIEHILPQSENLAGEWIRDLGGTGDDAAERAREVQAELVHRIGNLTFTRYNSNLTNWAFTRKRDAVDAKGNYIGFKNGRWLNKSVVSADSWTAQQINERTEMLVSMTMEKFAF